MASLLLRALCQWLCPREAHRHQSQLNLPCRHKSIGRIIFFARKFISVPVEAVDKNAASKSLYYLTLGPLDHNLLYPSQQLDGIGRLGGINLGENILD